MKKDNKNYFTRSVIFAAACIVWQNRRKMRLALLLRPKNEHHHLAGKWFFPGGRIEACEYPALAAIRETKEEIGIVVNGTRFVDICSYREFWIDGKGRRRIQDVVLFVYEGFWAGGTLTITEEAVDVRWVTKKDVKKFIAAAVARSHLSSEKVRSLLALDRRRV